MQWEVVIGLETHVQLSTESKIFSGASTHFGRFTTAKGDVIPNADMSEWSTVSRAGLSGSSDVPYPQQKRRFFLGLRQ